MTLADADEPWWTHPLTLRPWRQSEEERRFIELWVRVVEPSAASRHAAALFHASSAFHLRRATQFYTLLCASRIDPRPAPLPGDDPQAQRIEAFLWGFVRSAKLALDALAREISLIYRQLDEQQRFLDPVLRARWISFYTVRQKLLRYDEFRQDAVSRVLGQRTTGDTADPAYRALSHLANVGLFVPLVIGPILPLATPAPKILTISQCRVCLPDDPRQQVLTYHREFEVNQTGGEILGWLERFLDEVYAALVPSLERLAND